MARRRAISMAVNISQIAVWLGLVMTALPIVAENTSWTQQPQTYTKHVSPHCDVCVLHLGACEANRQNKCHESMENGYKSFFESENIPIRCLPGYELQENTPPSKASEPCICLPCNCEVPWQIIAIIATIIAFFSFLLNVHLLIERKKHRQNDFDEGGTGTSARQAAGLNNTNRENGLQEVTTSNGIPMTKMGESNERSLLNLKDGSCYDKSSDKDEAENSLNPPALSNLRRRKTFNYDPSPSTNTGASLGRETEMTPSEHSKKTQSEDHERSLFQKTVRQILNIGSSSLSNEESSNDCVAGISQQLRLPSEVRGSIEAGTSTEPSTLRRRLPFKSSFSEVMTRAGVERQITTESHANESDYTDKSDSEIAARGKHEEDSFSSSDSESDDDKPAGGLLKSNVVSNLRSIQEKRAAIYAANHARRCERRDRSIKLQSHEDLEYRGFNLRGGYGEKTNVNKLSVQYNKQSRDMPQTEQRKSEGKEDTEISSEANRIIDDYSIFPRTQTSQVRKRSPDLRPTIWGYRRTKWYSAPSKDTSCARFGPEENTVMKRSTPQTEQRKIEENKKTESHSETNRNSDYEENFSWVGLRRRKEKAASLKQKKGGSSSDNEIRYDGLTNPENSQGSKSSEDRDKPTEKASSPKLERGSISSDETSDDESHISRARAVTEIYPTHGLPPSCTRKGIKWNPMLQPPSVDQMLNVTYIKIRLMLLFLFVIFFFCVYLFIYIYMGSLISQIGTYLGTSVYNFLSGLVQRVHPG